MQVSRFTTLRNAALASAMLLMAVDVTEVNAAQAAPTMPIASNSAVTTTSASTKHCPRWRVKWRKVKVFELPTNSSPKVGVKHRRQVVTSRLCKVLTHYNANEKHWYLAIRARKADDGTGWIRRGAVRRIH